MGDIRGLTGLPSVGLRQFNVGVVIEAICAFVAKSRAFAFVAEVREFCFEADERNFGFIANIRPFHFGANIRQYHFEAEGKCG